MNNPNKKKGCGCIGKGCFLMIIIGVLFIGLGVWGYRKLATILRTHYVSDKATQVPGEQVTRDEYDALVKRLDAFKNAAPDSEETLELTAHDLNVLIAFSPEWESVRGKIHAIIDKDQMELAGSLPLSYLWKLRDQYLDGWIYFTPSMEDKVFHLDIQRIKLTKSGELSKDQVTTFSNYAVAYLTNSLLGDPVLGPVLIKAKTLTVKDGIILLTSG
jgi:hypothetical protein